MRGKFCLQTAKPLSQLMKNPQNIRELGVARVVKVKLEEQRDLTFEFDGVTSEAATIHQKKNKKR